MVALCGNCAGSSAERPQKATKRVRLKCWISWDALDRVEACPAYCSPHNPKVVGSNPTPATSARPRNERGSGAVVFLLVAPLSSTHLVKPPGARTKLAADVDARLLDPHDGGRRADGVAADPGKLGDDDDAERRAGIERGEERVEARPVLPLRAGGVLVDEDIARVDRPALPLGVRRRALDLPPRRARLRVAVAIVGGLSTIEGGDHDSASPFVIVVEVLPRLLEERRHPAGPGR